MSNVVANPGEADVVLPVVAVVGAGISGLIAARRLSQQGVSVIVFEASSTVGGQIRNARVAKHDIDMGAEALHISAPGMASLLDEVGLSDTLIHSNRGMSWLWTDRGLQKLPDGVGPSGPRKLRPVLRSGVMSIRGLLRAGLEPVIPRQKLRGDIGVGGYVRKRFGKEVVERFVDPVLGSLHAGDVYGLSLRAIVPELAAIADSRRSIMLSRRKQKVGPPLAFATWAGGLTTLTQNMLVNTGVEVRKSTTIDSIHAMANGGYELRTSAEDAIEVDAVIVAVPARVAAKMVGSLSHLAKSLLETVRYASVATVLVAYPKSAIEGVKAFKGTGLLVPSTRKRLLKAATFVSTKWPHMNAPDVVLIRLSCGRANESAINELSDADLVAKLHGDLVEATGIKSEPVEYFVQRWPNAMPQLEVGHVELISQIRADLAYFKGIHLAGASYDGLGIAACLRSGSKAASDCLSDLGIEKVKKVRTGS